MRSTVIGLCCAPVMELLLTELGKWWTVICARPQGMGRRDQMGRAPYLDSFGPNGVVFPFSSCNMGGHLLWGLRSMDVMKNDPRGALKCNTYGSAAAAIHKQSCRQWKPNTDLNMQVKHVNTHAENHTHSSCKKLIWSHFHIPLSESSNHLLQCAKTYLLNHTLWHTFCLTHTIIRCFGSVGVAAPPLLSYQQVFLDCHWTLGGKVCNTLWRFSDLQSLCYYETSTSDEWLRGKSAAFSKRHFFWEGALETHSYCVGVMFGLVQQLVLFSYKLLWLCILSVLWDI